MPFGNKSSGLVLVYEYGCHAPIAGERELVDELFRKNRLWNQFVEIERRFRKQRNDLVRSEIDDQIVAIQDHLNELRTTLKSLKADAAYRTIQLHSAVHLLKETVAAFRKLIQGNNVELPEDSLRKYDAIPGLLYDDPSAVDQLKKAIAQVKADLRPLYEAAKQHRLQLYKKQAEALGALEQTRKEEASAARHRANSGLYWCNADEVFTNYSQARMIAMKEGTDLKFHRFRPEGTITVRRSANYKPAELFGNSEPVSFTKPPDNAYEKGRAANKLRWSVARILINKDADNKPMFFSIPVCLHRQIPEDAEVLDVSVMRQEKGISISNDVVKPAYCYKLILTLRLPAPAIKAESRSASVMFSSRLIPGSGMAAADIQSKKKVQTVTLSESVISQFQKVNDLRSIQDKHQNTAQEAILQLRQSSDLPEWFLESTRYTGQWRSAQHYLDLYPIWKKNRFDGDKDAFEALYYFRGRHIHLHSWECHLRDQVTLRRREEYRNAACQLAGKYGVLELGDAPRLKQIQAETETQEIKNKRYWRKVAALSEFRNIIQNTARREGVTVVDAVSE